MGKLCAVWPCARCLVLVSHAPPCRLLTIQLTNGDVAEDCALWRCWVLLPGIPVRYMLVGCDCRVQLAAWVWRECDLHGT